MKRVPFASVPLLEFGHTIQIAGMILSAPEETFLCVFPDESESTLTAGDMHILVMSEPEDWERFLYQTDVLETEMAGPEKAIVRKSQRHIDTNVAWAVFERDGYRCRYCNRKGPLTVDHIVLWEAGGPSVADNLFSACRSCNRKRGRMPYREWIESETYRRLSQDLPWHAAEGNRQTLERLPALEARRVNHIRSR